MVGFKTEVDLSRALKRVLRGMDERTAYRRIEDSSGALGTFDSFGVVSGRAFWVELKVAGPQAKPNVRPGQTGFGMAMMKAGLPACFMVGHKDGSLRLLSAACTGPDWRDHIIGRFDALTEDVIWSILRLK
jgi:hypothetical protein